MSFAVILLTVFHGVPLRPSSNIHRSAYVLLVAVAVVLILCVLIHANLNTCRVIFSLEFDTLKDYTICLHLFVLFAVSIFVVVIIISLDRSDLFQTFLHTHSTKEGTEPSDSKSHPWLRETPSIVWITLMHLESTATWCSFDF